MSRHRRPEGFQRTDRIADEIQRELSRLFQLEMKDPRVHLATITEVKVSRDLAWADVYFTVLGKGAEESAPMEDVLLRASGFLRTRLSAEMSLRTVPRLRFHYDSVPEKADHIASLISQAREKDALASKADSSQKGKELGDSNEE